MVDTGNYLRFERVDDVAETQSGLVARLHRERLRIDLIRDDLVRIKISRGGVFDEWPTFAVTADMPDGVSFEFAVDEQSATLRTAQLVVSLGLDPFRIDVHRADGSAVVETARDEDGSYGTYATLNDAFTISRRCRRRTPSTGSARKPAIKTERAGTSRSGIPTC